MPIYLCSDVAGPDQRGLSPCNVQHLMSPLKGHGLGHAHSLPDSPSPPWVTVVWARRFFLVSFPDVFIKLLDKLLLLVSIPALSLH